MHRLASWHDASAITDLLQSQYSRHCRYIHNVVVLARVSVLDELVKCWSVLGNEALPGA